ncbi:hypothetical protein [Melissospora conviva]|uniref:hypothetical protein n=1 Tax=Melissospora conviva TaxID=3388432 RepID=UPI003C26902B
MTEQENLAAELANLRRVSKVVGGLAWGVAGLIMIYGVPIVFGFLVDNDIPEETAWILSIAVDLALAVGLVGTPVLAGLGIKAGWVGTLRWVAGFATWALNTAESWMHDGGIHWSGVFAHTWGPLIMFFAVEGAAYFQRQISKAIREKTADLAGKDLVARQEKENRQAEIRQARQAEAEALRRAEEAEAEAARKVAEAEAARQAEQARAEKAEAEAAAQAETRNAAERKAEEVQAANQRLAALVEEAKASARQARQEAAEQSEIAQHLSGQLNELRTMADRAAAKHALAEQHLNAREQELHDQAEELDRLRDTVERQQRQIASGKAPRKVRATVPAQRAETLPVLDAEEVPFDLPEVPGVGPETVKAVLAAALAFRKEGRAATQPEIASAAGVSDKTVRNVRAGLPADHWFRIPGKLPAELTAG